MESKKKTKKTTAKKASTKEKTTNKKSVTTKKSTKKNKKKGFTLIELLAVIIILGILMIIAIPSVTSYISNSRKSAYIDTAKEIVGGTRNLVNDGKLGMYDTNTTYYIPASYIETENASKSPYGEFTEAYVGVIYDGVGYKYYWISTDDAGQGVKEITPIADLDTDDIVSDLKDTDISSVIETTGIGSRSEIKILNPETGTWNGVMGGAVNTVSEDSGTNAVIYPEGKTKATVSTGEIVKIGSEEFYVIGNDGTNLVLLAHYNLNVGNNKKASATEGIQDSEVKGWLTSGTKYGNIGFSSTNYWSGKVGTNYQGSYCGSSSYTSGTKCAFVYDQNSIVKQYVDAYKTYLESLGASIKQARLLSFEETYELGCSNTSASCNSAPSWIYETTYWLGTAFDGSDIWGMSSDGWFGDSGYDGDGFFGVRPVIVI